MSIFKANAHIATCIAVTFENIICYADQLIMHMHICTLFVIFIVYF